MRVVVERNPALITGAVLSFIDHPRHHRPRHRHHPRQHRRHRHRHPFAGRYNVDPGNYVLTQPSIFNKWYNKKAPPPKPLHFIIDTALSLRHFSAWPKIGFKFPVPIN